MALRNLEYQLGVQTTAVIGEPGNGVQRFFLYDMRQRRVELGGCANARDIAAFCVDTLTGEENVDSITLYSTVAAPDNQAYWDLEGPSTIATMRASAPNLVLTKDGGVLNGESHILESVFQKAFTKLEYFRRHGEHMGDEVLNHDDPKLLAFLTSCGVR